MVATHGRGVWKVYYGTTTRVVERDAGDVVDLSGFSKVYSVDGRLVVEGRGQIRLKKGVYMVVSGNRIRKVIVR